MLVDYRVSSGVWPGDGSAVGPGVDWGVGSGLGFRVDLGSSWVGVGQQVLQTSVYSQLTLHPPVMPPLIPLVIPAFDPLLKDPIAEFMSQH